MLDELLAVDPCAVSDEALAAHVVALEAAQVQLDAARMVALGEFDARRVHVVDGATSTASWLRYRCGTPGAAAREQVRVAVRLRSMPATSTALAAGELSLGKVRVLALARTDRTGAAFDRDEAMLVGVAGRFQCDDLVRVVAHWKACADPDGVSGDRAAQWTRRRAGLVQGFDDSWSLHGTLDAESGAVIAGVWQRIVDEFRRADAGDALAPDRSAGQRSADALVELARRAGARDVSASRPSRPQVCVVLDHDTLVADSGGQAEMVDGTVVCGDAARRLACDASIRRVVVTGESEILDLGRSTPTPNSAQRLALELRDGGCIWPGCDRPPTWCDAHHLVAYQRGAPTGGPTDLDALGLLCRRHHHLVHDEHFSITRDPTTGAITVTRPDGTTASTTTTAGPLTRRRALTRPPSGGPGPPGQPGSTRFPGRRRSRRTGPVADSDTHRGTDP